MRKSPFKFLDAFEQEDRDIFFGREKETAQLYNAAHASNLVLVYGASGTGKTSLINCGLGNSLDDSDWLPLFVRRGNDLGESLLHEITGPMAWREGSGSADNGSPASTHDGDAPQIIRELYIDHYRPIYLIFDQFEELYIMGGSAEQRRFHQLVRQLFHADLPCKILLVIREEYIARLSDFEKTVPFLFDNRLRIEKMTDRNLAQVIGGMTTRSGLQITDTHKTISLIIENLRDKREGVDLTNLQVYLDRLFHAELERQGTEDPAQVTFDPSLVESVGRVENVLSRFIDDQLLEIEERLKERGVTSVDGVPLEILFTLVTEEGTKRSLDTAAILHALPSNKQISEDTLNFCLAEFRRMRLLRQLGED